jgi:peptidoglycan/xylan/chitin deacetylase (PgdA/CDA1 family)
MPMPDMPAARYWDGVFRNPDPWDYGSDYEQAKYRQTLDMVRRGPARRALEIGCAEGMFTAMLAGEVAELLAMDVSGAALARAAARCSGHSNVTFVQHDLAEGLPQGEYDLIVCSETLYYLRDADALRRAARAMADALAPGGRIVMAHVNMVSDDRTVTGFDFNEFGAAFIAEVFGETDGLALQRDAHCELYRIQEYRRAPSAAGRPEVIALPEVSPMLPSAKRGGCVITDAEARFLWASRNVPVLMYHRIASGGPPGLAPYRVAPEAFEQQLDWLRRHGWRTTSLAAYCRRRFSAEAAGHDGRLIILTFDDAYEDFAETAWPLLRQYGFGATVFVPAGFSGGRAEWDRDYGPPAAIMDWEAIRRLHAEGVEIGSHGMQHVRADRLPDGAFLADTIAARRELEQQLGAEISGYCYPYAFARKAERLAVKDAGHGWAVAGTGRDPLDHADPFYLPRIEVLGSDSLADFAAKIPEPERAEPARISFYEDLRRRRDRRTYLKF